VTTVALTPAEADLALMLAAIVARLSPALMLTETAAALPAVKLVPAAFQLPRRIDSVSSAGAV